MSYWDRVSGLYKFFLNGQKKLFDTIWERTKPFLGTNLRVLEAGAGPGVFSKRLAPLSGHLTVTDYSEGMVRQAEKRLHSIRNVIVQREDIMNLSFPDSSFDRIYAANTLHIIPNPKKALSELRRVLKDDGLMIAPNFLRASSLRNRFHLFLLRLSGCTFYNSWSMDEYVHFLESGGFQIVKKEFLPASVSLAYVVVKKQKGTQDERESSIR